MKTSWKFKKWLNLICLGFILALVQTAYADAADLIIGDILNEVFKIDAGTSFSHTGDIYIVGNGSLLGAWMSEMSNHIRRDVVEVVRMMTSFELSEVTSFKDQFIASLFLPHTDASLFPHAARRLKK